MTWKPAPGKNSLSDAPRLAFCSRREVRKELHGAKNVSAQHRACITALKRRVARLERAVGLQPGAGRRDRLDRLQSRAHGYFDTADRDNRQESAPGPSGCRASRALVETIDKDAVRAWLKTPAAP